MQLKRDEFRDMFRNPDSRNIPHKLSAYERNNPKPLPKPSSAGKHHLTAEQVESYSNLPQNNGSPEEGIDWTNWSMWKEALDETLGRYFNRSETTIDSPESVGRPIFRFQNNPNNYPLANRQINGGMDIEDYDRSGLKKGTSYRGGNLLEQAINKARRGLTPEDQEVY